MTSLVLLGWAAAVALTAVPMLDGRSWTRSLPRLTVGLWLAAELSATVAVLAAGLLVAVPPATVLRGLDGIIAACARALSEFGAPNTTLALVGLLATALLAGRLAVALTATLATARRWRRRHQAALSPVARPGAGDGWQVVDHAAPIVYCLPGRPGQVIVTTGALAALSAEEFAAVLRHENAHLRGRHHLLVALTVAFRRAFPGLPLAHVAEREVRRLVEHLADDRASERHGRQVVATAIVRLAGAVPEHALGAGATSVDRVRRMLAPPARPSLTGRVGAAATVGLLLAFPPATALVAAGTVVHQATCPTTPPHPAPPAPAG